MSLIVFICIYLLFFVGAVDGEGVGWGHGVCVDVYELIERRDEERGHDMEQFGWKGEVGADVDKLLIGAGGTLAQKVLPFQVVADDVDAVPIPLDVFLNFNFGVNPWHGITLVAGKSAQLEALQLFTRDRDWWSDGGNNVQSGSAVVGILDQQEFL